MIRQYIDLDDNKIREVDTSKAGSTYRHGSNSSPHGSQGGAMFSFPPSPASSPATAALQNEFSNLVLPSNNSPQYVSTIMPNSSHGFTSSGGFITSYEKTNFDINDSLPTNAKLQRMPSIKLEEEYTAKLVICEQPVEKFRFRYKSEMHGTHGSLNGASSKRSPKTYPEVELKNFTGNGVIRCSLFQANLESPHSHQLVVRNGDQDICDPHILHVSQKVGYVAQFQNMGIIHTAKKYIYDELLKKKLTRLRFELGRDELTTKEEHELRKQTEKEAKDMNLNQVRLCFEAFKVEDNKTWSRIASPVYTNLINNRKSAQTGELRICRLSIVAGSVKGGDDLILLVEKVSKKNIKVRFYELNDDDEVIWEAHATFREADVHHQYAIVCQTPPYRSKDIEEPVYVFVELVRPSDDERSSSAKFRYKPLDVVVSRKRRRTCSTATSSGSSSGSLELPKTLEATQPMLTNVHQQHLMNPPNTISEEFNKSFEIDKIMNSESFRHIIYSDSDDLSKMCNISEMYDMIGGSIEMDGTVSNDLNSIKQSELLEYKRNSLNKPLSKTPPNNLFNINYKRINTLYEKIKSCKTFSIQQRQETQEQVSAIFHEHTNRNSQGETLIHEAILNNNTKFVMQLCYILSYFKLNPLINQLNNNGESCLHYACLHGHAHFIRPLIGLDCSPNLLDGKGNTALHVAIEEQHSDCCEALLATKKVVLDVRNDVGLTALHLAIHLKNYTLAHKLLDYDKSASLVCNTKDENNALHMAVLHNNMELVKKIVEGFGSEATHILRTATAAGHTALDLARTLKEGSPIVNYLAKYFDNEVLNLSIKEETSSSSAEDFEQEDDDTEDEAAKLSIDIKEEEMEEDVDDDDNFSNDNSQNLNMLFANPAKLKQLVYLLERGQKWRHIADKIKIGHLKVLWLSADAMMSYIQKNCTSIDYQLFAQALADVEPEALMLFKSI